MAAGAADADRDVVVVGGGPAGATAGIFTARYGLDTVVFDRGNASLRRCAYLESYPGFPGGVDIPRFYALLHAHVEEAGADLVHDMVVDIARDGDRFRVETQDDRTVSARRVVAATTYDGDYLRGVADEDALFETREHHGDVEEVVDWTYADDDGRTPIDGVYFAGAMAGRGQQAAIAVGHGAEVARTLLAETREDNGYWPEARAHYDWLRRRDALDHDWDDEATWRERFDDHHQPSDRDLDPDRLDHVRERELAAIKDAHLTRDEIEARADAGQRHLVRHLDPDVVLDELDNDVLRAYVRDGLEM